MTRCASECPEPAPGAPNVMCPDGSTGGPICERMQDGSCDWTFRRCPRGGGGSCDRVLCPEGTTCEIVEVDCMRESCPSMTRCVPVAEQT